jgi:hypothetical protein
MNQQHGQRTMLMDEAAKRTTAPGALIDANGAHAESDQEHEHEHGFEWPEALRIALVAVAAGVVWFRLWEPLHAVSVIGVIGLIVGGWPILTEAFENMRERRMWSSKSTDASFSNGAVRIRCRPRVTQHGGATKTAL